MTEYEENERDYVLTGFSDWADIDRKRLEDAGVKIKGLYSSLADLQDALREEELSKKDELDPFFEQSADRRTGHLQEIKRRLQEVVEAVEKISISQGILRSEFSNNFKRATIYTFLGVAIGIVTTVIVALLVS